MTCQRAQKSSVPISVTPNKGYSMEVNLRRSLCGGLLRSLNDFRNQCQQYFKIDVNIGRNGCPNVFVDKCVEARAFTPPASKASGIPPPSWDGMPEKLNFEWSRPGPQIFPGAPGLFRSPAGGAAAADCSERQRTIVPATSGFRISRRSFMQMSWAALTNTWVPLVRSWTDACSPSFG